MIDVVPDKRPTPDEARLLYERYRPRRVRRGGLRTFYALKPLIPRPAQIAVRRLAARRQRNVRFPRWPAETALLEMQARKVGAELATRRVDALPIVNLWPGQARFAVVLTHDVESRDGLDRVNELLEIEQRYGFVSSWNVCGDWYPVADSDLDAVRNAGCEVGLHGLKHDGRLFLERSTFTNALPAIADTLQGWGAVGFRSPALGRNAAWMHELPCEYDSSFPDTDPFQPQPGGCCSIHPYFLGDVVELPITLDQDFTLFELLGERSIARWVDKSRFIIRHHGLINVLVHPDYMDRERLALYDQFLAFLAEQDRGWHALPRDVAQWWRTRDQAVQQQLRRDGTDATSDEHELTFASVRVDGDAIVYDL